MKEKFNKKKLKLFKFEAAIALTGIVMLLVCGFFESSMEEKNENNDRYQTVNNEVKADLSGKFYEDKYEKQIEYLLSSYEGLGKTSVAVHVKSNGELYPATNFKKDNSIIEESVEEGTSARENKDVLEENVVIIKDSQGNESVFCTSENAPEIEGVAICIKGGVSNVEKKNILEAIMALYDISSSKISIIG